LRLAFVLRLGNDTRPADGWFEGWIEEVDSCTERRFRSTQELLKFLGDRFDLATSSSGKRQAVEGERPPVGKKHQKNYCARKSNLRSGSET
jgi:hypothetical protein